MSVESFLHLSRIGTPEFRRALVAWLRAGLSGKGKALQPAAERDTQAYVDWAQAWINDERLKAICAQSDAATDDVIERLTGAWEEIERSGQGERERQAPELALHAEIKALNSPEVLPDHFERIDPYLPTDFYRAEWQSADPAAQARLHEHLLRAWDERLFWQQSRWELEQIDRLRQPLLDELYRQIDYFEQLQELLAPFTGATGRLWDRSKGLWADTGLNVLRHYYEQLRKDPNLQALAELLGRLRQAELEWEELQVRQTHYRPTTLYPSAQKSEFTGVRESDELSQMLPSEVALLAHRDTELLFLLKFAEKKLLTWEYSAKYLNALPQNRDALQRNPKPKDQGPIILCIDTSGSMSGMPERIAKLLSFALLRIALRDNRACYLISFSTQIETLDLRALSDQLPALVRFLGMSFHGGTDTQPALRQALHLLYERDYEKADVLIVSDFLVPALPQVLLQQIQQAQGRSSRFYGLQIGNSGNRECTKYLDANWSYEPSNPEQSLLRLVETLREKGL